MIMVKDLPSGKRNVVEGYLVPRLPAMISSNVTRDEHTSREKDNGTQQRRVEHA